MLEGGYTIQVMIQPERQKRKNILINTYNCRSEVDTVQYVINKHGYRESQVATEGHVFWYGVALRDNDIDLIKQRKFIINRYPLMDVSK